LPKLCSKGSITITTLERYINVWHIITIMRRKAAIQRRGDVTVNPNFVKINLARWPF